MFLGWIKCNYARVQSFPAACLLSTFARLRQCVMQEDALCVIAGPRRGLLLCQVVGLKDLRVVVVWESDSSCCAFIYLSTCVSISFVSMFMFVIVFVLH